MLQQLLFIIELVFALSIGAKWNAADFVTKAVDDLSAVVVHVQTHWRYIIAAHNVLIEGWWSESIGGCSGKVSSCGVTVVCGSNASRSIRLLKILSNVAMIIISRFIVHRECL